jgi:hypothetical protein
VGVIAKLIAWVLPARPKKLARVYVKPPAMQLIGVTPAKLTAQMAAEKVLSAPPYTPLCQDPRCEKCVRARRIAALYLAHPN